MRILTLFLALAMSCAPAWALENRLQGHPSPYLALHGEDPVHWQPWGQAVLDQARKEGKLIFISSGYFSCHWCHVMQRESYQNTQIAALLNQYFIPVKLDRELNPALDEHLIDFVQRTQGHAGWPLNVFLTPDGYPVAGATYLPPDQFKTVLQRLSKLWQTQRSRIETLSREALGLLNEARSTQDGKTLLLSPGVLYARFVEAALQRADDMAGGFGQQNRFPMAPQLLALLELQAGQPNPELAHFLQLTLDQMARKGLRDHLAGGFFRYTVDPDWMTPHYEKMLYTQALLARLYLRASQVFGRPDYAAVARDTLDFVLRDMAADEGGFVAAFSAIDDQGEEGGYYLWTGEQLKQVLPAELLTAVVRHWSLSLDEGKHRLPMPGNEADGLQPAVSEPARALLLKARRQRGLPVDDKVLAGWNGLLLWALAEAGEDLKEPRYRAAAGQLARFLRQRLWDGQQLWRAWVDGRRLGAAALEDYAYVAAGMLAWSRLSQDPEDRRWAGQLLALAWERFYDDRGWRGQQQALLPGMPAVLAQDDSALPAPAMLILKLSLSDPRLAARARAQWPAIAGQIENQPFWYATAVMWGAALENFKATDAR